jgi:quercetin dioxygenase-like cupin family protein
MRTTRKATLAALLPPLLLLTACGDEVGAAPLTEPLAPPSEGSGVALQQMPPIHAEPLTGRHVFTDNVAIQIRNTPDGRPTGVVNVRDATHLAMLEITIEPGARFPWHTHPGPVAVAVVEGEFRYVYADDCVPRDYSHGAFIDPGFDNVHTAYNPSETSMTRVIATFFGVPADGPLTIPVSAEVGADLDEKCGLAPAVAHAH